MLRMIKGHCFVAVFLIRCQCETSQGVLSCAVVGQKEARLGHTLLHNLQNLSDSDSFIFISKREATHLGE